MTCLIIAKLPCSIILFAFGYAKDRREPEYGRFAAGRDEDKIVIAQQLSTAAEEFYDIDGDRASGAKLLGVHLEAQDIFRPASQAHRRNDQSQVQPRHSPENLPLHHEWRALFFRRPGPGAAETLAPPKVTAMPAVTR